MSTLEVDTPLEHEVSQATNGLKVHHSTQTNFQSSNSRSASRPDIRHVRHNRHSGSPRRAEKGFRLACKLARALETEATTSNPRDDNEESKVMRRWYQLLQSGIRTYGDLQDSSNGTQRTGIL